MAELLGTDEFLVNRNDVTYTQQQETLMATLQDTDHLLVNRAGQTYKITGEDLINSVVDDLEVTVILAPTTGYTEVEVTAVPVVSGGKQPDGGFIFTYQWVTADDAAGTNKTNITGANAATFTPDNAQVGKYLGCVVSTTDALGTSAEGEAYIGPIQILAQAPVIAEVTVSEIYDGSNRYTDKEFPYVTTMAVDGEPAPTFEVKAKLSGTTFDFDVMSDVITDVEGGGIKTCETSLIENVGDDEPDTVEAQTSKTSYLANWDDPDNITKPSFDFGSFGNNDADTAQSVLYKFDKPSTASWRFYTTPPLGTYIIEGSHDGTNWVKVAEGEMPGLDDAPGLVGGPYQYWRLTRPGTTNLGWWAYAANGSGYVVLTFPDTQGFGCFEPGDVVQGGKSPEEITYRYATAPITDVVTTASWSTFTNETSAKVGESPINQGNVYAHMVDLGSTGRIDYYNTGVDAAFNMYASDTGEAGSWVRCTECGVIGNSTTPVVADRDTRYYLIHRVNVGSCDAGTGSTMATSGYYATVPIDQSKVISKDEAADPPTITVDGGEWTAQETDLIIGPANPVTFKLYRPAGNDTLGNPSCTAVEINGELLLDSTGLQAYNSNETLGNFEPGFEAVKMFDGDFTTNARGPSGGYIVWAPQTTYQVRSMRTWSQYPNYRMEWTFDNGTVLTGVVPSDATGSDRKPAEVLKYNQDKLVKETPYDNKLTVASSENLDLLAAMADKNVFMTDGSAVPATQTPYKLVTSDIESVAVSEKFGVSKYSDAYSWGTGDSNNRITATVSDFIYVTEFEKTDSDGPAVVFDFGAIASWVIDRGSADPTFYASNDNLVYDYLGTSSSSSSSAPNFDFTASGSFVSGKSRYAVLATMGTGSSVDTDQTAFSLIELTFADPNPDLQYFKPGDVVQGVEGSANFTAYHLKKETPDDNGYEFQTISQLLELTPGTPFGSMSIETVNSAFNNSSYCSSLPNLNASGFVYILDKPAAHIKIGLTTCSGPSTGARFKLHATNDLNQNFRDAPLQLVKTGLNKNDPDEGVMDSGSTPYQYFLFYSSDGDPNVVENGIQNYGINNELTSAVTVSVVSTDFDNNQMVVDGGNWGKHYVRDWSANPFNVDPVNVLYGFDGESTYVTSNANATDAYFEFDAIDNVKSIRFERGNADWTSGLTDFLYAEDTAGVKYQLAPSGNAITISIPNKSIVKLGGLHNTGAAIRLWAKAYANGQILLDNSIDFVDGDDKVEYQTNGGEGTIIDINTDDNTLLIANTGDRDNRWIADNYGEGSGTSTDFYVAPKNPVPIQQDHAWCKLQIINNKAQVTGIQKDQPGYLPVPTKDYSIKFPAVFPTGDEPDDDIPRGACIAAIVAAENSEGRSVKESNCYMPADVNPEGAAGPITDSTPTILTVASNANLSDFSPGDQLVMVEEDNEISSYTMQTSTIESVETTDYSTGGTVTGTPHPVGGNTVDVLFNGETSKNYGKTFGIASPNGATTVVVTFGKPIEVSESDVVKAAIFTNGGDVAAVNINFDDGTYQNFTQTGVPVASVPGTVLENSTIITHNGKNITGLKFVGVGSSIIYVNGFYVNDTLVEDGRSVLTFADPNPDLRYFRPGDVLQSYSPPSDGYSTGSAWATGRTWDDFFAGTITSSGVFAAIGSEYFWNFNEPISGAFEVVKVSAQGITTSKWIFIEDGVRYEKVLGDFDGQRLQMDVTKLEAIGLTSGGSNNCATVQQLYLDGNGLYGSGAGAEPLSAKVISTDLDNNQMIVDGGKWIASSTPNYEQDFVSNTTLDVEPPYEGSVENVFDADETNYMYLVSTNYDNTHGFTTTFDKPLNGISLKYYRFPGGTYTYQINDETAINFDPTADEATIVELAASSTTVNKLTITQTNSGTTGGLYVYCLKSEGQTLTQGDGGDSKVTYGPVTGTGIFQVADQLNNTMTIQNSNDRWIDNRNRLGVDFYVRDNITALNADNPKHVAMQQAIADAFAAFPEKVNERRTSIASSFYRLMDGETLSAADYALLEETVLDAVNAQEPFALNGFYPLYYTSDKADAASSAGSHHSHTINGVEYYMPDGGTLYHGNYIAPETAATDTDDSSSNSSSY